MLLKIAEMNREIGQYDDAISAYEEYLEKFRTDQDQVKTILGSLYLERVRQDDAYEMFSPIPIATLTDSLTDPELLTLGKIFQAKGDDDKALEIFEHLGDKDVFESTEALALMADIYQAQGNEEKYSEALERVMGQSPDSEQGLVAMIEYAELHYDTQTAAEWRNFLDPVYQVQDTLELRPRAEMVQIRALLYAKDVFPLVSKIEYYVSTYPEENTNRALLQIKEDVLFEKAQEFLAADNDRDALTLFNQLLSQFPESPKVPVINQYIDDIY